MHAICNDVAHVVIRSAIAETTTNPTLDSTTAMCDSFHAACSSSPFLPTSQHN
jgi:hypothetical protein